MSQSVTNSGDLFLIVDGVIRDWRLWAYHDNELGRVRMGLALRPRDSQFQRLTANVWYLLPHARDECIAMSWVRDLATEQREILVRAPVEPENEAVPLTVQLEAWLRLSPDLGLLQWLKSSPKGEEFARAAEAARLEAVARNLADKSKIRFHYLSESGEGGPIAHVVSTDFWRVIAWDEEGPPEAVWTQMALRTLLHGIDRWHQMPPEQPGSPWRELQTPHEVPKLRKGANLIVADVRKTNTSYTLESWPEPKCRPIGIVNVGDATSWSDLRLKFVNGEAVSVYIKGKYIKDYMHDGLGMAKSRGKGETEQWKLLREFSEAENNTILKKKYHERRALPKRVEILRKALKRAFGIPGNPVETLDRDPRRNTGWRLTFSVQPERPGM